MHQVKEQKNLLDDLMNCIIHDKQTDLKLSELTGVLNIYGVFHSINGETGYFAELSERTQKTYLLNAFSTLEYGYTVIPFLQQKNPDLIRLLNKPTKPTELQILDTPKTLASVLYQCFSRCINHGVSLEESYKELNKEYNRLCF